MISNLSNKKTKKDRLVNYSAPKELKSCDDGFFLKKGNEARTVSIKHRNVQCLGILFQSSNESICKSFLIQSANTRENFKIASL